MADPQGGQPMAGTHQLLTPQLTKYMEDYDFKYMSDVGKTYDKLAKIGQGTFGEVFKARHRETKRLVALKKILMENEKEGNYHLKTLMHRVFQFPITALREIKMLQKLNHKNVTELIEICSSKASSIHRGRSAFYLVLAFCEHDLAGLLSNSNVKFSLAEIKEMMKQLLNGLYYIHKQKILHRDMKAANVLITKNGVLKLADFGLARPLLKIAEPLYTNRVVTLWYRPPELLLGERQYTTAIDCWGAGCIMAELWTRSPIMQGETEQKQLNLISQLCGSITPEVWPDVKKLPLWGKMELAENCKRRIKDRLGIYLRNESAVDLIDRFLSLDPSKRISADDALNHAFFWSDPMPDEEKLKRVLSRITTSMFEFTVPRRRPGHHGQNNPPGGTRAPNAGQLVDRIF